LANISIVSNNLFECETPFKQIAPVQGRHRANFRIGGTRRVEPPSLFMRLASLLNGQRFNELIEKYRNPVIELIVGELGFGSASYHSLATINQDHTVRLDEVVEHPPE